MPVISSPRPKIVDNIKPQIDVVHNLIGADPHLPRLLLGGTVHMNDGLIGMARLLGSPELIRNIEGLLEYLGGTALRLGFAPGQVRMDYDVAKPGQGFRPGTALFHEGRSPQLTVTAAVDADNEDAHTKWAVGEFPYLPMTGGTSDRLIEIEPKDRAIMRALESPEPTLSIVTFHSGDVVYSEGGNFYQHPINWTGRDAARYYLWAGETSETIYRPQG